MAERILKFGGIDPLTQNRPEHGEAEPDSDPRTRQGTEIVSGFHLMSAVEQLEPATTTQMAYFDPDAPSMALDELEQAVRDGRLGLQEVMTRTERFTPLVNPRRSRQKDSGDLGRDSDADLWHVPTDNYQAMPPRQVFQPLAQATDDNDAVDNGGVYGEFRERRNGGEVFGDVWFDDFDVGEIDNDPVRLGFRFGWNYFGDRAFFIQPFAQQTRCKNSVAPLDDKQTIMHHNRSVDWRETWDEALRDLGMYGDELSQRIADARDILFDFGPGVAEDAIDVPMNLEDFYEHLGMPDPNTPADRAREEARNSPEEDEGASRVSAWHLHAGATYWLSWHWNGAEDSRAFREYRRTANDLLFNPHQIAEQVQESYEDEQQQTVVNEVLGPGRELADATPEERAEIEDRLADHEGVVEMRNSVESLGEMVEQFEDTEERLDRMQEAVTDR